MDNNLKASATVHHGESASCLHVWKLSSPGGLCFPMALLWHESWPFTLMAGTMLRESVTMRSAYNKISLLFQLTWQTPWRTNAYNCQHLVWDLINGVFFQVQFHQAKWRLQSPHANAGACKLTKWGPRDRRLYSTRFREVFSETKATYLWDQMRRRKINILRMTSPTPWFRGVIYLLCDNGPNVYTTPKSAKKIQHLCNPCLQSTQRN